jgi:type I restriction enzyme S subunit
LGQTIFQEWFGHYSVDDPESLPEGWRIGKLGEVVEFINGYAFKSENLLSEDSGNCYKVFKMGNIKKGGGFEESKTKSFIKKDDFKGSNKYILKQGDLLMSMTDMKDAISLLGHTALMTYNNEYVVNQRVGLIRASNNININYPFLYLLTNNDDFIANLRGRANSGVQVNLSTEAIKNSKFIIPDNITNKKFNDISIVVLQKIRDNEIQIQSLSSSCDSLLPKLMSGEVKVEF